MYSKDKCQEIWKKVAKILRTNFAKMWTKDDAIHETNQTIRQLLKIIKHKNFADSLVVAAPHLLTKSLAKYFRQDFNKEGGKAGLDFITNFISYNFVLAINHYQIDTFKIVNSDHQLFLLFWQKMVKTFLGNDAFIKTNNDLFQHFCNLLLKISYTLYLFLDFKVIKDDSFKDSPFIFYIYSHFINEEWKISLDWRQKRWILHFKDEQKMHMIEN